MSSVREPTWGFTMLICYFITIYSFFDYTRLHLFYSPRGQRVKIFDFKTRFLPLYFQHLQSQNNKGGAQGGVKVVLDPFPDPDVMLSFGQRWDDRRPIENTLIWAKVYYSNLHYSISP